MHALAPFLASANGWHDDHWWIVFPILWLLVGTTLIVLFLRRSRDGNASPRQILGERYARGEIDLEEYRDRLSQLR